METGQVAVTPEEDFTLNLDELSDEALKKMRPEQIRELIAKLQARRPELMKGAGKVGPGSKKGRSKKGRSKKAEPEVLL